MKISKAVEMAVIDHGYRHIDCASVYGNEKEIGQAFDKIFSSKNISRKDMFVTSKLWNTDHHPDNVEIACRKTLNDLQLEYLDLYLVHWGVPFVHGDDIEPIGTDGIVKTEQISTQQTWKAMEALVDKGLVKSIGVANFTAPMIVDLLTYASFIPVINQIEIHPYNSQKDLVDYCHKKEIKITAYSPLGSYGDLQDRPISDEVVIKIAKLHNKTPAQVLIKWCIHRGLSVIPKSTNSERIAENIDVFALNLTDEDMEKLDALNKDQRYVDPSGWWGIPYFK